jgi:hypothetical protein
MNLILEIAQKIVAGAAPFRQAVRPARTSNKNEMSIVLSNVKIRKQLAACRIGSNFGGVCFVWTTG